VRRPTCGFAGRRLVPLGGRCCCQAADRAVARSRGVPTPVLVREARDRAPGARPAPFPWVAPARPQDLASYAPAELLEARSRPEVVAERKPSITPHSRGSAIRRTANHHTIPRCSAARGRRVHRAARPSSSAPPKGPASPRCGRSRKRARSLGRCLAPHPSPGWVKNGRLVTRSSTAVRRDPTRTRLVFAAAASNGVPRRGPYKGDRSAGIDELAELVGARAPHPKGAAIAPAPRRLSFLPSCFPVARYAVPANRQPARAEPAQVAPTCRKRKRPQPMPFDAPNALRTLQRSARSPPPVVAPSCSTTMQWVPKNRRQLPGACCRPENAPPP